MRTEQRVAGSWGDMDARQAGVEVSRLGSQGVMVSLSHFEGLRES